MAKKTEPSKKNKTKNTARLCDPNGNKVIYMIASVAYGWSGAVTQVKSPDGLLDEPTDRPTDRLADSGVGEIFFQGRTDGIIVRQPCQSNKIYI